MTVHFLMVRNSSVGDNMYGLVLPRPRKVIHIVESLDRGAVENWLLRVLEHARCNGTPVDWAFYCILDRPGALENKARSLGARVVRSPAPLSRPIAFIRALRAELKRGGYDVLHGHHDLLCALYLIASAGLPLSRRIVHVHNADEALPTPNVWKQRLYRPLMRRICLVLADRIVGISNHTLDRFLAGRPRRGGRDVVHYYGIDARPFTAAPGDRAGFREQLGHPSNARLLLFFSRMVPEKNPLFAIDVLAAMRRIDPNIFGVFVGSGSLEGPACARAAELGIGEAFRHLGWRSDGAEIMACCDLFILPRPEHPLEGLGISVVEAQLAGMRMLLSQGIAADPLLPTAVYRRLPLSAGAEPWAQAGIELLAVPTPSRAAAAAALEASPFDMDFALRELLALHESSVLYSLPRAAHLA